MEKKQRFPQKESTQHDNRKNKIVHKEYDVKSRVVQGPREVLEKPSLIDKTYYTIVRND